MKKPIYFDQMGIQKAIFDTPSSERPESPEEPYLVIYPKDHCDLSLYASGYFEAAELLIDTLIKRRTHASDDRYAFPILYNLIHSLELHLKIYLGVLSQHYQRKSCQSLQTPSHEITKVLGDHNLRAIYETILKMVDHDKLHGNRQIKDLEPLLNEIEGHGLNVESLRYYDLKGGAENKLTEKQRWIYLGTLKNSYGAAIELIKSSYLADDLLFCGFNEFNKSRVDEINYIVAILSEIKEKSGFEPINDQTSWNKGGVVGFSDIDPEDFDKQCKKEEENKERIKTYIQQFEDNKLVLANRGIRFGKSHPMSVPDKEWIKANWTRAQQLEYLSEDFYLADSAIGELSKHKSYIESRIEKRKQRIAIAAVFRKPDPKI